MVVTDIYLFQHVAYAHTHNALAEHIAWGGA